MGPFGPELCEWAEEGNRADQERGWCFRDTASELVKSEYEVSCH